LGRTVNKNAEESFKFTMLTLGVKTKGATHKNQRKKKKNHTRRNFPYVREKRGSQWDFTRNNKLGIFIAIDCEVGYVQSKKAERAID